MSDFTWKGKRNPSIFILLQKFQMNLSLNEDILTCGLCFMRKIVETQLRIEEN